MSAVKIPFAFLIIFAFSLQSLSSAHAEILPDDLSKRELLKIIEEVDTKGEIRSELSPLFVFPQKIRGSLSDYSVTPVKKSPVFLQQLNSRGDYLVTQIFDKEQKLIFTDVTRFHYSSKCYHRWRISSDQEKPIMRWIGQVELLHAVPDFTLKRDDIHADLIWHACVSDSSHLHYSSEKAWRIGDNHSFSMNEVEIEKGELKAYLLYNFKIILEVFKAIFKKPRKKTSCNLC